MIEDLVKRMNDARDFPANTCGASRHAAMIAEALCKREDYPMLAEEPEHCGGSIAATVAALWECRAKLAESEARSEVLETLVMDVAADLYDGVPAHKIDQRIGDVMKQLDEEGEDQ